MAVLQGELMKKMKMRSRSHTGPALASGRVKIIYSPPDFHFLAEPGHLRLPNIRDHYFGRQGGRVHHHLLPGLTIRLAERLAKVRVQTAMKILPAAQTVPIIILVNRKPAGKSRPLSWTLSLSPPASRPTSFRSTRRFLLRRSDRRVTP